MPKIRDHFKSWRVSCRRLAVKKTQSPRLQRNHSSLVALSIYQDIRRSDILCRVPLRWDTTHMGHKPDAETCAASLFQTFWDHDPIEKCSFHGLTRVSSTTEEEESTTWTPVFIFQTEFFISSARCSFTIFIRWLGSWNQPVCCFIFTLWVIQSGLLFTLRSLAVELNRLCPGTDWRALEMGCRPSWKSPL